MMRSVTSRCRSTLAVILALVTVAAANAQEPKGTPDTLVVTLPAPPPSAASQPAWDNATDANPLAEQTRSGAGRGLIWKVSSGSRSVYLLGSIHVASSDMYPLPRHIEEAFRNSDVLVVEVDLNKIDQSKLQPLLLAKGMYPFNDSLWNHVSPQTKTLVAKFCDENGMPSEVFARFKPWLATVMASMLPLQASGMKPELGIDQHFLNLAGDRMRVEQLETAEWQLRLLSDIPENKQEQYLAATLKTSSASQQLVQEFKNAWMTGDADKLDRLVSAGWEGASGLQKRVFGDRNPHMADAAQQCLMNHERCFIVVGAGHLVGKEGVVRLLQDRGFKAEQLPASN
ncbi:MAG: TraB/GumN family protein [Acidobacteriia bacterium]|nr:TraB/GumN family protein [Terriglobia bacterium]